jgi:hydrogenase-4 component B
VHFRFQVTPIFERYLYRPAIWLVRRTADLARPIQNGDVNLYLFYVFVVVVIAYAVYT